MVAAARSARGARSFVDPSASKVEEIGAGVDAAHAGRASALNVLAVGGLNATAGLIFERAADLRDCLRSINSEESCGPRGGSPALARVWRNRNLLADSGVGSRMPAWRTFRGTYPSSNRRRSSS